MKEKDWLIVALFLALGYVAWRNHQLGKKNDALVEKTRQLELLKLKFTPPKTTPPKTTPPQETPPEMPPVIPGGPQNNLGNITKRRAL